MLPTKYLEIVYEISWKNVFIHLLEIEILVTCVKVFNMSLDSTSRHLAKYNVVKYNVN